MQSLLVHYLASIYLHIWIYEYLNTYMLWIFVYIYALNICICIFDGISNETGKLHIIHTRAQWFITKAGFMPPFWSLSWHLILIFDWDNRWQIITWSKTNQLPRLLYTICGWVHKFSFEHLVTWLSKTTFLVSWIIHLYLILHFLNTIVILLLGRVGISEAIYVVFGSSL